MPPPVIGNSSAFFKAESVREKLKIQSELEKSAIANGVPGDTITWFIDYSGATPHNFTNFGVAATDFLVPNDYNVDDRDDIAVWRPGAPTVAAFYILNGGDFTIRDEPFGQTGDDTAITGDYDGDGIADLASYRCPALGAGDGSMLLLL